MGRRIPNNQSRSSQSSHACRSRSVSPTPGYISFHVSNDRALAVFKDVVLRRRDVAMGDT